MGSSSSRNVSTLKQKIESRTTNINTTSFKNTHSQSMAIVASSETGPAEITIKDTQIEQSLEAQLTGTVKAVMANSIQTDLSQVATQMAKAATSGFNPGNFSSANNEVHSTQDVFHDMLNKMETTCEQEAKQDMLVSASSRSGAASVTLERATIKQVGTSMANCVGDVMMSNISRASLSQTVKQTAIAETVGLNLPNCAMIALVGCGACGLVSMIGAYFVIKAFMCYSGWIGGALAFVSGGALAASSYALHETNKLIEPQEKKKEEIIAGRTMMQEFFVDAPSRTVLQQAVLEHKPTGGAELRNTPRTVVQCEGQTLAQTNTALSNVAPTAKCVALQGISGSDARSVFMQAHGRWVHCVWIRDWSAAKPVGSLLLFDESLFPKETVHGLQEDFTYKGFRFGRAMPMWHDAGGDSQRMPPPRLIERSMTMDAARPQLLPSCRPPASAALKTSQPVPASKYHTMFGIESKEEKQDDGKSKITFVKRPIIVNDTTNVASSLQSSSSVVSAGSSRIFTGDADRAPACVSRQGWLREWDALDVPAGEAPMSIGGTHCDRFRAHVYAVMDHGFGADFPLGVERKTSDGSKDEIVPALMCGDETSETQRPFPGIDADAMTVSSMPAFLGFRVVGSARFVERVFKKSAPPRRHTDEGEEFKSRKDVDEATQEVYMVADYGLTDASIVSGAVNKNLTELLETRKKLYGTIVICVVLVCTGLFFIAFYLFRGKYACGALEASALQQQMHQITPTGGDEHLPPVDPLPNTAPPPAPRLDRLRQSMASALSSAAQSAQSSARRLVQRVRRPSAAPAAPVTGDDRDRQSRLQRYMDLMQAKIASIRRKRDPTVGDAEGGRRETINPLSTVDKVGRDV